MDLAHLVFVSSLTNEFGHELPEILQVSSKNNARDGIHGMFLCQRGNVMGVLQGSEPRVRAAYDRMVRDCRHFGLHKLLDERADTLDFEGTIAGLGTVEFNFVSRRLAQDMVFKASKESIAQRVQSGTCRNLLLQFSENGQ
jgi:hypothetical protein